MDCGDHRREASMMQRLQDRRTIYDRWVTAMDCVYIMLQNHMELRLWLCSFGQTSEEMTPHTTSGDYLDAAGFANELGALAQLVTA